MTQILIIDDDPTVRLVIARALKSQGYEVILVNDGKAGLEAAIHYTPSLIICDWNMPGMDGLEVCQKVKQTKSLANTYFILLTARDEVSDLVRGLENGADDFLSKPANQSELRARVRAGLRINSASRQLQKQKQLLEEELTKAADYVRSLLPANLEGNVRSQSCFMPSIQLGGDCFDYYWLDDDHLVTYVLDVSGHGVGAALLSVSIQNLLRSARYGTPFLATDFRQPQKVLMGLNDYFQMSAHQEMYFTIWYGVYHRPTRTVTYSAAGHPPALLIDNNRVSKLSVAGLPIGIIPEFSYEQATTHVPIESSLYIFSDGAYEIRLANDQLWGLEGLIKALTTPIGSEESRMPYVLSQAQIAGESVGALEDDLCLIEIQFPS